MLPCPCADWGHPGPETKPGKETHQTCARSLAECPPGRKARAKRQLVPKPPHSGDRRKLTLGAEACLQGRLLDTEDGTARDDEAPKRKGRNRRSDPAPTRVQEQRGRHLGEPGRSTSRNWHVDTARTRPNRTALHVNTLQHCALQSKL